MQLFDRLINGIFVFLTDTCGMQQLDNEFAELLINAFNFLLSTESETYSLSNDA